MTIKNKVEKPIRFVVLCRKGYVDKIYCDTIMKDAEAVVVDMDIPEQAITIPKYGFRNASLCDYNLTVNPSFVKEVFDA